MKKLNFLIFILPIISIYLKPTGYLNDFAGILSYEQKQEIEKKLIEIENKTTNEIAVLIINSLEGKSIEEYANEIFNSWGIGKKGKDNGVLILIALKEREIRIEVGYGLESYLPDSVCGRIIREVMAPNFRKNDFYTGIKEGIEKIYEILEGKNLEFEKKESVPPIFFLIFWYFMCILFGGVSLGLIGVFIEVFLIVLFLIFLFLNMNNPLFEFFLLLSLVVPFLTFFILVAISPIYVRILKSRLKKIYGKNWKKHIPVYLRSPIFYSNPTYSSGGGFSGSFGGFGGGMSGGGGASGRW
jgi:uncharacterized protein